MAKSSKERESELILKLDFKSVLLVLDMTSLKGTQFVLLNVISPFSICCEYSKSHYYIPGTVLGTYGYHSESSGETFKSGMFLPILQKWKQVSDYSQTHHKTELDLKHRPLWLFTHATSNYSRRDHITGLSLPTHSQQCTWWAQQQEHAELSTALSQH